MKNKGVKFVLWVGCIILLAAGAIPSLAFASGYHGHPSSWDAPGKSSAILHKGTPASAGMSQGPLTDIDRAVNDAIAQKAMPGAVVLVARKGTIAKEQAYGYAYRYTDNQFTEASAPVLAKTNTIYDIASISKLFTSIAAMQLFEKRKFALDDPVAKYIPVFAENGKENVTIRQLLTDRKSVV